jgi:hypothetical protein
MKPRNDLKASAEAAAAWMLSVVQRDGVLHQHEAVAGILDNFSPDLVHENDLGNQAISSLVLRAFRNMSEATVVWERGDRLWRLRERHDLKGRQQA